MDAALCARLAEHGRGNLFAVGKFEELPARMLALARTILG